VSRIEEKFAALKRSKQKALIPFVTAGDPDFATSLKILRSVDESGADLIEVGVPFSDPMADGPTIQRASGRALKAGATLARVLDLVGEFRRFSQTPVILFGYYNPFFRYGLERLAESARARGVDAVLCVDLPPEESHDLEWALKKAGLDLIFLLAPTSGSARAKLVSKRGRGFVYYVSVLGVTGARAQFASGLHKGIADLRRLVALPVCVGFGVSTPAQAAWLAAFSDGVVVGSALINAMENRPKKAWPKAAGNFIAELKGAMLDRADGKRRPALRR